MEQATVHVPMVKFGTDHWSLLVYIETRAVDHGGDLNPRQLRTDGLKYPTRLVADETQVGHNDYDCLHDLAKAGLIVEGPGLKAWPSNDGWELAGQLRRRRAEKKTFAEFNPSA